MKILWLTNIPSPYRVDFFNEIGKYCELTVLFEKNHSSERDDTWKNYNFVNFTGIFLGGKSIGVAETLGFSVLKHIKKNRYDHIIVTNYFDFTGMLAVYYMKLRGIPYSVEGDGAFAGSGKGIKEKIKKSIISKATYCFSTANEHDKYYVNYGAEKDKIVRYPFSSVKASSVLNAPLSFAEKQEAKNILSIKYDYMVLAVGQFIHRKGFDNLLKAVKTLPSNVGVYIVGGEPTEEYIKLKESLSLANVHFEGFKNRNELADYYRAADVFVLPTREDIWGLVINEAMSFGLPVITTSKCIAGLEMVKDTKCILDPEDIDGLSLSINYIINDDEYRENLSQQNLETSSKYTIETMAEGHLKFLSI